MKNSVIVILFFLTVFVSCNETQNSKNDTTKTSDKNLLSVEVKNGASLFNNMSITPLTIKVNNDSVTKIKTLSGTEIIIPSQTFVDADGKLVSEKVRFEYKEIRTIADMLVENTDMQYDSAGVTYNFQTAGMFEMKAYVGNKPVFIKEGKSIEVSYKSNVEGNYNFYSYRNNNWIYEGKPTVETFKENIASNSAIKNLPLLPIKANPKEDLIINLGVDYKQITQLKEYDNIIWKYAGTKEKSEVYSILKKYIRDKKLRASNKKSIFEFSFKIGKKEHSLLVSPVFTGKAYKKALSNYNRLVSSNTKVFTKRKFSVTKLGLKNHDIFMTMPNIQQILAKFQVVGKKVAINQIAIYQITGNDDVLIPLHNNQKMSYSLAMKNKIIAILPGNIVATLSSDKFTEQVSDNNEDTKVFSLVVTEQAISSTEDLDKIISSL